MQHTQGSNQDNSNHANIWIWSIQVEVQVNMDGSRSPGDIGFQPGFGEYLLTKLGQTQTNEQIFGTGRQEIKLTGTKEKEVKADFFSETRSIEEP